MLGPQRSVPPAQAELLSRADGEGGGDVPLAAALEAVAAADAALTLGADEALQLLHVGAQLRLAYGMRAA
jgi:hypothetical protein